MTGKYILDERGEPVLCDDLITWARWFENGQNRVVNRTELLIEGVTVLVSTVFLGLDRSWDASFDPLTYRPTLWETMIFGGAHNLEVWRYKSLMEAEDGHQLAVLLAQREKVLND